MSGAHRDAEATTDEFRIDHTRPPSPPGSELAWESTITAPTEWVPYVYTDAEVHTLTTRRRISVASLTCGGLGLLIGIFGVWGVFLSLAGVILALIARNTEHRARLFWASGLVTGLAGVALGVGWFVIVTQTFLA
ncbi:hypothetical protein [Cryobacterium roopkundense]|uniref:DUF4190 domain-containing protein n=1 Tax=Cryobacterium roopkundense TaxID=1001240 RepID=A0A7W8ZT98_9MICO|nr:hypothetical protein [Cryobacterium roopkundense]MBB5639590.1 hypothetical protein [Cryobacterium roopkundense]